MSYPKVFEGEAGPPAMLELVHRVTPQLIEGVHPALAALRTQYGRTSVKRVELTGTGFLAEFNVPRSATVASPSEFAGGHASIELVGAELRAGCILYVRDGLLSVLEGFTYKDEWPEDALVQSVEVGMQIEPNTTLHEDAVHGRAAEVVWRRYPRREGSKWGSKVLQEVVRRLRPRCLVVNLLDLDDIYGMPLVSSLVVGAHAVRELDGEGVTRIAAVGEVGEMLERFFSIAQIAPLLHLTICSDLESALAVTD